jgi:hypothetical protein
LKAPVTKGLKEEGEPYSGEMKEKQHNNFFPSAEVVGGGHGGSVRPAGGGGLLALLRFGRRKKEAGWAKRLSGSAGCWAD